MCNSSLKLHTYRLNYVRNCHCTYIGSLLTLLLRDKELIMVPGKNLCSPYHCLKFSSSPTIIYFIIMRERENKYVHPKKMVKYR